MTRSGMAWRVDLRAMIPAFMKLLHPVLKRLAP
jgi:hypothetical protein